MMLIFISRADDFNDPIHLERISTLNTFIVKDLGGIPNDSLSEDYTSDYYRINDWYGNVYTNLYWFINNYFQMRYFLFVALIKIK